MGGGGGGGGGGGIGGLFRELLGGWGMMFLGDIAGRTAAGLGWGQQAATAHQQQVQQIGYAVTGSIRRSSNKFTRKWINECGNPLMAL